MFCWPSSLWWERCRCDSCRVATPTEAELNEMSTIPQPIAQSVKKVTKSSSNRPQTSLRLDRTLTWFASHAILIFFTVIIVYPVIWMVLASFKNQDEVVNNIWGLPTILHWENYAKAWTDGGLGIALVNSTLVSLF